MNRKHLEKQKEIQQHGDLEAQHVGSVRGATADDRIVLANSAQWPGQRAWRAPGGTSERFDLNCTLFGPSARR
ncbi:hypothetical protein EVAR_62227_1 [Eumeta japonica]|uniref:Uncharacterized protein n=1 Tax=Eumeta variegata TaxID=151549 RepID=A0A4C1ZH83_EUMVA|nr:hypothetical protein EVAR_62227_1 [Eumeta japonica]